MEKIAAEFLSLFEDTLDLYKDLKGLVRDEKEHIIEMDVKKLWAATEAKKSLALSIETLLTRIVERANVHCTSFTMEAASFNGREMVDALPLSAVHKFQLKKTLGSIDACREEVSVMANENKRYISEYLLVIDGIFSTVVGSSGQEQYSGSGMILPPKGKISLVNAEV